MRIRDWSSDVCSSDLLELDAIADDFRNAACIGCRHTNAACFDLVADEEEAFLHEVVERDRYRFGCLLDGHAANAAHDIVGARSEEHTSELQSLMRISYAVFCLKKNKNSITQQHTST